MKKYFLMLAIVLASVVCFAENSPFSPPDKPKIEDDEDPTQTPIDGGVSLLIAAGVAYAGKKYRDYKKNSEK